MTDTVSLDIASTVLRSSIRGATVDTWRDAAALAEKFALNYDAARQPATATGLRRLAAAMRELGDNLSVV